MSNQYKLTMIPMHEILCDGEFNVRGWVNPAECFDLAKDIKERGLDIPISVWPTDKNGFKWSILAGHRRFTACRINDAKEIPCYIRDDIQNEYDALAYNLRENILRKDLTLAQEAKRVGQMLMTGKSSEQVANSLGKTAQWVKPRKELMELGPEVFDAAEKRIVNQNHISVLYGARKDRDKMLEILRQIKERYESGEKGIKVKEDLSIADMTRKRRPKGTEAEQFREFVYDHLTTRLDPPGGDGYFPHKIISWFLGDLTLAEIYRAAGKECDDNCLEYEFPKEVADLLEHVPV